MCLMPSCNLYGAFGYWCLCWAHFAEFEKTRRPGERAETWIARQAQ